MKLRWKPSSTPPGHGPAGNDHGGFFGVFAARIKLARPFAAAGGSGPVATPSGPRRDGRRAMTLVEVIAGLVLLTTVLAAVGVARGRFLRQWADADRQLQATRAADELLAGWLAGPPDRVPVGSGGPLPGADGFRWSAGRIRDAAAERLGSQVVRLEVTRPAGDGSGRRPEAVLAVEFLLRDDRLFVEPDGEGP